MELYTGKQKKIKIENVFSIDVKPTWRNGLACWTSKSKVVGSSPTGDGIVPFIRIYLKSLQTLLQTVESSFFALNINACQK